MMPNEGGGLLHTSVTQARWRLGLGYLIGWAVGVAVFLVLRFHVSGFHESAFLVFGTTFCLGLVGAGLAVVLSWRSHTRRSAPGRTLWLHLVLGTILCAIAVYLGQALGQVLLYGL